MLLELELDPARHKTGAVWHVALPTATLNLEGLNYCFRVNVRASTHPSPRPLPAAPVDIERVGWPCGYGGLCIKSDNGRFLPRPMITINGTLVGTSSSTSERSDQSVA